MAYGYGDGFGLGLLLIGLVFLVYLWAFVAVSRKILLLPSIPLPLRICLAVANLIPLAFFWWEWNFTDELDMLSPAFLLVHLLLLVVLLIFLPAKAQEHP